MIECTIEANIAIIEINTRKGNTFTYSDLFEFFQIIQNIKKSESIIGIIITGSGKSFSIGGDLDHIISLDLDVDKYDFFKLLDNFLIELFSVDIPVISAINGHAIGLGFLIILCSDFCYSLNNENIKFGLPEIKVGLAVDSIMLELLKYNNFTGKFLEKHLLTGNLLNIRSINEIHIINKYFDKNESLLDQSKQYIIELEDQIYSFKTIKKILRKSSLMEMKKNFSNEDFTIFVDLLNNIKK